MAVEGVRDAGLLALWAKSDAAGSPHSLVGHLLDSAAVAEIVWDEFLAPLTQQRIDGICPGRGRDVFRLLCGWHDLGKATPEFQRKVPELGQVVEAYGHPLGRPGNGRWHHGRAGAVIVRKVLLDLGLPRQRWMEALIEGHHGRFAPRLEYAHPGTGHGKPVWEPVQSRLAHRIAHDLGVDLADLPLSSPDLGTQLALSGYLSMVDWIASSDQFPGTGTDEFSLGRARARARDGWQRLGLSGGWSLTSHTYHGSIFEQRFDKRPTDLQRLTIDVASSMPEPGLMVIEAPMGEGKTEAAFAAIEILAARFGCDGFVFAMPTQGTTDAMYNRCRAWAHSVWPGLPVALLHGKAMANESYWSQLEGVRIGQVAEPTSEDFGVDDPYTGNTPSQSHRGSTVGAPSEWLLGRHRGLLSPGVVGTIDQILYAATRTKYVQLRHAGLAGKVVVVDEVHSYDIYMSQFLLQLLRWCSTAGFPVVLLSATLAPALRSGLLAAYRDGLTEPIPMAETESWPYPRISTVASGNMTVRSCAPWRSDRSVSIEVLAGDTCQSVQPLAARIAHEVQSGGCALVILNTVRRAQEVYRELRDRGLPATLVHGRLTTRERADRTEELVRVLGAQSSSGSGRPDRLVVVATQIAEQSFDVDADILFTDLAPVDLLLQRLGRLHRHQRAPGDRPDALQRPRVIVSGLAGSDDRPELTPSFEYVYARRPLLVAAGMLWAGAQEWAIPSQIDALVASAYSEDRPPVPSSWLPLVEQAATQDAAKDEARAERARTYLLKPETWADCLAGLHHRQVIESADEAIVVRDGEPSVEVALVVFDGTGYFTLAGRPLGSNGERCTTTALAREVIGDSVRLSERDLMGTPLGPLSGWAHAPLLSRRWALVLDTDLQATLARRTVRYDTELGLTDVRATPGHPADAGTRTGAFSTLG